MLQFIHTDTAVSLVLLSVSFLHFLLNAAAADDDDDDDEAVTT